jgi:hypothetical protein
LLYPEKLLISCYYIMPQTSSSDLFDESYISDLLRGRTIRKPRINHFMDDSSDDEDIEKIVRATPITKQEVVDNLNMPVSYKYNYEGLFDETDPMAGVEEEDDNDGDGGSARDAEEDMPELEHAESSGKSVAVGSTKEISVEDAGYTPVPTASPSPEAPTVHSEPDIATETTGLLDTSKIDKSADKATGKPVDKQADKQAGKQADKPADKPESEEQWLRNLDKRVKTIEARKGQGIPSFVKRYHDLNVLGNDRPAYVSSEPVELFQQKHIKPRLLDILKHVKLIMNGRELRDSKTHTVIPNTVPVWPTLHWKDGTVDKTKLISTNELVEQIEKLLAE